jgi:hypothetical protein
MHTFGTITPKGKAAFVVTQGYTSPNDYFTGRQHSEITHQIVWARNAYEAQGFADQMDTMNGTAVGWESLDCRPA